MKIDRHNYEEYFILFMDNELNDADRRAVEVFVQTNPDLKDELDVLLQSKFIPDHNIIFENKGDLIKTTENTGINMSNYEEWLMLYIDNELSATQKIRVEEFAAQHPSVKTDLQLFSKTKFDTKEAILFPDKELLYRKTEKVRVISMRWWRVAAAAILVLAFGVTSVVVLNNRSKNNPDNKIVSTKPQSEKTGTENLSKKDDAKNESVITQPNVVSDNTGQSKTDQVQKSVNKVVVQKNEINNTGIASKKTINSSPLQLIPDKSAITDNVVTNDLPNPINNPNIKMGSSVNSVVATINSSSNKNTTNSQINNNTVTDQGNQPSIQKTAPEYASLEEGSNKKSRGFFRKVVRLFSKTTKINPADDDGRLMIGAVTVNLR